MVKKSDRIYQLYLKLLNKHGDPRKFWPGWCSRKKSLKNREEIAIGAILTQRTNWKNVEMALANLAQEQILSIRGIYNLSRRTAEIGTKIFSGSKSLANVVLIAEQSIPPRNEAFENFVPPRSSREGFLKIEWAPSTSDLEFLAQLIHPAGFYHQKARRLWEFCRLVIEEYGDLKRFMKEDLAVARQKLLSLWGIGPETADSILLYALDKPSFVIDEYTRRLVVKKKITQNLGDDYLKNLFENQLRKGWPCEAKVRLYQDFHALIVVEEKGRRERG